MPHFRVAPRLCFKLRLSAKPWIWRFNNNYWMRLSKILWFVNQRLRQIIDLRDTDKSPYFASSIILLLFQHSITEFVFWWIIFMQEWLQEGEKSGYLYAWAEYYMQPNKVGRHCTWAHMVGSWPMKGKIYLQWMIIFFYFHANKTQFHKVLYLASFWKWAFLELRRGQLNSRLWLCS